MTGQRYLRNKPGFTNLIGKTGVSKADARIDAIGSVDEASAALGLAKSFIRDQERKDMLNTCQQDLSTIMAYLAGWGGNEQKAGTSNVDEAFSRLEENISRLEKQVCLPKQFILSGDSSASGSLDLARTIVRRAERNLVGLFQSMEHTDEAVLEYLNRLSTLCFLLEVAETGSKNSQ
ncbi:MAG: cob(I)yrinic acid a,c-diamide adenosyltransferase [Anaerolineaceae bacterium]